MYDIQGVQSEQPPKSPVGTRQGHLSLLPLTSVDVVVIVVGDWRRRRVLGATRSTAVEFDTNETGKQEKTSAKSI